MSDNKKTIARYPINWKKLHFKKGKKIIVIDGNKIRKKYDIDAIIKLADLDFKKIKKNTKNLTHFNIQYTGHKRGKKYLIVRIARRGHFDGRQNVSARPAILNSTNFILAKCVYVRNNVRYENLKKNSFYNSLSNIKNVTSLKSAIIRRYKKSLAHLSSYEKLSLGVAITKLIIIKRLSKV